MMHRKGQPPKRAIPLSSAIVPGVFAALLGLPHQNARAADPPLIVSAARVYPAPDLAPIDDAVVIIRDGRIVAVGSRSETLSVDGRPDARCGGGIVTASFQNSHVHFTEPKWQDAGRQPAAQLTQNLTEMLTRFGFTTVVDTGSNLDNTVTLRERIERGEVTGPRILSVGWPLYPPDGIPIYLRDLPPEFLKRLPQPASVEEAVQLVRTNLARGADATKLFVATPQLERLVKYMPPDILEAATRETQRRGRLVMAHPTDIPGIRAALAAGVDVLVHTTLGKEKTEWDPMLIQAMLARDVAVIPTLQLWAYELRKSRRPANVIELATGDAVGQLRAFAEAGGQVLFGTDVGYMTEYDPTDEYVYMLRAGLTFRQILASLTTAPAARWKESERRGRVAAGLDADLVVLEAEPAKDIRNLARTRCVFRAGKRIYPP
jgi:imidazolonepropionase-like amidohydrolase